MPTTLEVNNGSNSIFASETMGGLVQLDPGDLAVHLALGFTIRFGANGDANRGDFWDINYFG